MIPPRGLFERPPAPSNEVRRRGAHLCDQRAEDQSQIRTLAAQGHAVPGNAVEKVHNTL
jgi:hypothetical protein